MLSRHVVPPQLPIISTAINVSMWRLVVIQDEDSGKLKS